VGRREEKVGRGEGRGRTGEGLPTQAFKERKVFLTK